ncbi:restriction endonuclease subunit S [Staphylococcus xylosus]
MTNEVKNVPELRFPGFEDEWKEKKLGTIFTVTMGQSPNSTNYTDNPNDTILVQGNADIYKGKIWPRIYTKEITKLLERNDIILSVRAPVGEIGIAQVEACIGRGVCSIKGNKFLYYFLDLFKKQNRWSRFSQGSTFESISGKDIRDLKFYVCNSEEQNKIGEFFNKLDRQIELEEQKLEKLEEQKKGYMQKFFSQELRFKDENDNDYPEWDETTVKEIASVSTGNKDTKDAIENGKYEFYVRSPKIHQINSYSFDGEAVLTVGDGVGVGKVFHYVNGKFDYHQRVYKISNFNNYNALLFYYYFSTHFLREAQKYNAKTSVDSVRRDMIINMKIPNIIIEEQEKISNFLSKLDELINKQGQKIDDLKLRKQGFLQKMFV